MIKLEITIRPKRTKYLEFSQSLDSIKTPLMQCCTSLVIGENNKTFTIVAAIHSTEQLTKVLSSRELRILSGAMRTLGEKTNIKIHNGHNSTTGIDLRQVGSDFLKNSNDKISWRLLDKTDDNR